MFVPAKDEICFTCQKRSWVQFVYMVAAWLEIIDTGLRLEERGCYGSKLRIYSKNIHSKWRIQGAPTGGGALTYYLYCVSMYLLSIEMTLLAETEFFVSLRLHVSAKLRSMTGLRQEEGW